MNVGNFNRDVKKVRSDNDAYIILRLEGMIIAAINENDYEEVVAESSGVRGLAEITLFNSATVWADEYELVNNINKNSSEDSENV